RSYKIQRNIPKLTPMVRFGTAPGIGKNYPIKFLIFIRGAMSIELDISAYFNSTFQVFPRPVGVICL
ncbi:MAG: hypothetical protein OXH39_09810, partial [Candidatus Poribacteria bacterium]|nr:hypothetical protein [Candidatus Poribacteria bacterium]